MSESARFEIGRIPQGVFGVLGRNLVTFLILSVVLLGVPGLISQLLTASINSNPALAGVKLIATAAISIVGVVFSFILQAALVGGTISDLNGRKLTAGEMLAGKAPLILPLFGLGILQGFATGLGFVFLLVPGLIMMTVWIVTVPALVIEKTGVFGSFSRSAELTRGHRWSVFAILLVYFIAVGIISSVNLVLMGGTTAAIAASHVGFNPIVVGFNVVFNVLIGMVSATGVAVIYYELRRSREGVAPQALVDTFS